MPSSITMTAPTPQEARAEEIYRELKESGSVRRMDREPLATAENIAKLTELCEALRVPLPPEVILGKMTARQYVSRLSQLRKRERERETGMDAEEAHHARSVVDALRLMDFSDSQIRNLACFYVVGVTPEERMEHWSNLFDACDKGEHTPLDLNAPDASGVTPAVAAMMTEILSQ